MVILVVSRSMESGEDMQWREAGLCRKEKAARWVQGRHDEALLSTVSVRMEQPDTFQADREAGDLGKTSLKAVVEPGSRRGHT